MSTSAASIRSGSRWPSRPPRTRAVQVGNAIRAAMTGAVVRGERVLAPVVREVPPDGVDVVRAVLGVVVLDEEAGPADARSSGPGGLVGPAQAKVASARPSATIVASAASATPRVDAAEVVADQRLQAVPPSAPGRRGGCRSAMPPTSARRPLPLRMSGGATRVDDGERSLGGRQRASSARASRSSPSSARSPARGPSGTSRGWRRGTTASGDEPAVDHGQVDRDVVPAEAPRPGRRAGGIAEHREPVALRVAPHPVAGPARRSRSPRTGSSATIARTSAAPALAHRGIDHGPGAVPLLGVMSPIASPRRGPGR